MRNFLLITAKAPGKLLGYIVILFGFCLASAGASLAKVGAWLADVDVIGITLPADTNLDLTDEQLRSIVEHHAKSRKPD